MAIQFYDGFDDYGSWSTSITSLYLYGVESLVNGSFATTSGAFGGTAIGLESNSNAGGASYIKLPGPLYNPTTTVITGARRYYTQADNQNSQNCYLDINGNTLFTVGFSHSASTSTIFAKNSLGTTLGSATYSLKPNNWIEFESSVTISSSGSVTVLVNGNTVLNLNNVNTHTSSTSLIYYAGAWDYVYGAVTSNNTYIYIDDMYVLDTTGSAPSNTFLSVAAGPMGPRVYTLFPQSNNVVSWGTNTATQNYKEVNETSFDGDTTYVYTQTQGASDYYNINTSSNISTVLSAQVKYVARMDNSGTKEVASLLQSSGNIQQGNTNTLTANYTTYIDLYNTDPSTGLAWSNTKIMTGNAIQVGVTCVL